MADKFESNRAGLSSPAVNFETVTPDDVTPLANVSRALWVGVAGNVAVLGADNVKVTFVGVQAGTLLPIRIKRVDSTNTTSTDMIALS